MRAERRTAGLAMAGCGLLLAGCASMPADGEVREVPPSQVRADSGVRVYALPPEPKASERRIVTGFLEALMSDDFRTAAGAYLVREKQKEWKPGDTTVLAKTPTVSVSQPNGKEPDRNANATGVQLVGERIATVDANGTYRPAAKSDYVLRLRLEKERGEWRIADPPPGLVLGKADFQRNYRSVNTYFFTDRSRQVLTADPVFVRKRIDPVTESVRALLDGPGTLLSRISRTEFPDGARLVKGQRLRLDEENRLRLRLRLPSRPSQEHCERMAAQVLHTVQSQEGVSVSSVQLLNGKGRTLCELTSGEAEEYAPDRLAKLPDYQYFVNGEHRLVKLRANAEAVTRAMEVLGPFGDGKIDVDSAAVSRSEHKAAVVSGRRLYVAPIDEEGTAPEAMLTSQEKKPGADSGLTAPSWDGLGDLWVADRVGDTSRLYRLAQGDEKPQVVEVEGLGTRRIESLRVSADGSRIAMVVGDGDDRELMLGAIAMVDETLVVRGLTEAAPQLQDVRAVSWAGDSRLVVVGREDDGLQGMRYVTTDGWMDADLGRGLTKVEAVAASEDDKRALVAQSEDGIVRLPPDADWNPVAKEGTAPVYPG